MLIIAAISSTIVIIIMLYKLWSDSPDVANWRDKRFLIAIIIPLDCTLVGVLWALVLTNT